MKTKLKTNNRLPMARGKAWCFFVLLFIGTIAGWSQQPAQTILTTNAAPAFSNSDCLGCHLDPTTTRTVNGKVESLVISTNDFAHSVHAKLNCVDCHTGVKDLVHDPLGAPGLHSLPSTGGGGLCNEHPWCQPFARGVRGGGMSDCHGSHGILPVKDPASPVFKLNLPYTCAKCHSNAGLTRNTKSITRKRRRSTWKASMAARC